MTTTNKNDQPSLIHRLFRELDPEMLDIMTQSLGAKKGEDLVQTLKHLAQNDNMPQAYRESAIRCLALEKTADVTQFLIGLAQNPDNIHSLFYEEVLRSLFEHADKKEDHPATKFLVELATHKNPEVRYRVAEVLSNSDPDEDMLQKMKTQILGFCHDKDPFIRGTGVFLLSTGKIKDEEVLSELLLRIYDSDDQVARQAFTGIKHFTSLEDIQKVLKSADPLISRPTNHKESTTQINKKNHLAQAFSHAESTDLEQILREAVFERNWRHVYILSQALQLKELNNT